MSSAFDEESPGGRSDPSAQSASWSSPAAPRADSGQVVSAYSYAPEPRPEYQYPQQGVIARGAPSNGLGVAGFVLGLLGLLFFWLPVLGAIMAILGVIFGGV